LAYLVKTNEIVYAPSASVVAVIRQQPKPAASKNLLLVADPVFNGSDPRAKGAGAAASAQASADTRGLSLSSAVTDVAAPAGATAPATGLQLARLNGTRVEAQQIAQLTRASGGQADVWLDLEANEAKVMTSDIKKYRVVHIATHGLLNAERPQFTGVVLSLVGNKSGDGFMRTDEIFNLNLGNPLVMLSACETGLGKEKRGEGVIGLTRAFMYAGAPTVGVSLWSVADKSTADLMTDFYKRLLASPTASPTASMRAAQLGLINGKRYAAPFYWAPFVLVGEWK
jgi:CHAT domain-containing protein